MNEKIEEIILEARERESLLRAAAEEKVGTLCNSIRGFIEVSGRWKAAVDEVLNIDSRESATNQFAARAVSLSVLTNRTLEISDEIVRVLHAGSRRSALANWRALAEAKNHALLIDVDVSGTAGFLWLHYGIIEKSRIHKEDEGAQRNAEISKRCLGEAGFEYSAKKREHWAKGTDGKPRTDAVARSEYVAKHRKLPPRVDRQNIELLARKEQNMIREANAVVHPTFSRNTVNVSPTWIMLAAIIDPMSVMLAYKVAASDAAGWPYTETVGEQFHLYPTEAHEVGILSLMVEEAYGYCLDIFGSQFKVDDSAA